MECINCPICGDELENMYVHELKCGHKFHYECLMMSFKSMKNTTLITVEHQIIYYLACKWVKKNIQWYS